MDTNQPKQKDECTTTHRQTCLFVCFQGTFFPSKNHKEDFWEKILQNHYVNLSMESLQKIDQKKQNKKKHAWMCQEVGKLLVNGL